MQKRGLTFLVGEDAGYASDAPCDPIFAVAVSRSRHQCRAVAVHVEVLYIYIYIYTLDKMFFRLLVGQNS